MLYIIYIMIYIGGIIYIVYNSSIILAIITKIIKIMNFNGVILMYIANDFFSVHLKTNV